MELDEAEMIYWIVNEPWARKIYKKKASDYTEEEIKEATEIVLNHDYGDK